MPYHQYKQYLPVEEESVPENSNLRNTLSTFKKEISNPLNSVIIFCLRNKNKKNNKNGCFYFTASSKGRDVLNYLLQTGSYSYSQKDH